MAERTIKSVDGDYPSLQAWENDIGSGLSNTENQTASIEEAFDVGGCTMSHGGTADLKVTVPSGSSFRHSEQPDWPEDQGPESMELAAQAGAHANGEIVNSGGHTVLIEYTTLTRSAASSQCLKNGNGGTMTVHHCLFDGQDGKVTFGFNNDNNNGSTTTFHHCIFFRCDTAVRQTDTSGTLTASNCTMYAGDATLVIRTGGTMTLTSCIVMQPLWTGSAVCLSGTMTLSNVLTSDATGTTGKINKDPAEIFANANRLEMNLHFTTDRRWPSDLLFGVGWESNSLARWSGQAQHSIVTTSPKIGTYNHLATADGNNKRELRFSYGPNTNNVHIVYWIELSSGLLSDFSDGNSMHVFQGYTTTLGFFIVGNLIRESGAFKLRFRHQGGTYQKTGALNTGQKYRINVKAFGNTGASDGTFEWFLDGVLVGSEQTGFSLGTGMGQLAVSLDKPPVGATGTFNSDHYCVTSEDTDPGDPSGSDSPYGDSTDGVYEGAVGTGTVDFQGVTRVDWDIGALEIPGGVAGISIPIVYHHRQRI